MSSRPNVGRSADPAARHAALLHACLREVVDNLALVSNDQSQHTERRAGRLLADLQYGRIDEIPNHGPARFPDAVS